MEESLLLAHEGERENDVNEKLSSNIVVVRVWILEGVVKRSNGNALGRSESKVSYVVL